MDCSFVLTIILMAANPTIGVGNPPAVVPREGPSSQVQCGGCGQGRMFENPTLCTVSFTFDRQRKSYAGDVVDSEIVRWVLKPRSSRLLGCTRYQAPDCLFEQQWVVDPDSVEFVCEIATSNSRKIDDGAHLPIDVREVCEEALGPGSSHSMGSDSASICCYSPKPTQAYGLSMPHACIRHYGAPDHHSEGGSKGWSCNASFRVRAQNGACPKGLSPCLPESDPKAGCCPIIDRDSILLPPNKFCSVKE